MFAYGTLALMFVVWAIVFYAGSSLQSSAAHRADELKTARQQSNRTAFGDRLRVLAAETKAEREQLERIAGMEIISIVNMIENAGRAAGVPATVSDALPETPAIDLPAEKRLVPVAFVVKSSGSFVDIIHMVELLELLPLPSAVSQMELERDKDGTWIANIKVRVFTAASVSL